MTLLDIAEQGDVATLDQAIYELFDKRGVGREIHFSELAKVGGLGGWRTRVSTARKMFKARGLTILNRVQRRDGRTDSYYVLAPLK